MLDKHLLDGLFGEVGVDGLAAFVQEVGEGGGEDTVAAPLPLDKLGEALADIGHLFFELGDGFFPCGVGRPAVAEKALQRQNEVVRLGEVGIEG